MNSASDRLAFLLHALESRDLTPEENNEFKLLLEQPEGRRLYAEHVTLSGTMLECLRTWAVQPEIIVATPVAKPMRWLRPRALLWSAAAALVVVGCSLAVWQWGQRPKTPTLTGLHGEVKILRSGSQLVAVEGQRLKLGDRVTTGLASSTSFTWPGERTKVTLASSSDLEWQGGERGKKLSLHAGSLDADVDHQPSGLPMLLTTPQAQARILGTKFSLNSEQTFTKLDVEDGRVLLQRDESLPGVIVSALQTGEVWPQGAIEVANQPVERSVLRGLIAHWRTQDEQLTGLRDMSDHGNTLMLHKIAGWTDGPDGLQALSLRENREDVTSPPLNLGEAFSCSLWVRLPSQTKVPHPMRSLLANGSSGTRTPGFRLVFNTPQKDDGRLMFETGNGVSCAYATSKEHTLQYDRWHHISITVDRERGSMLFYVDGQDVTAPNSSVLSDFPSTGPVSVGTLHGMYQSDADFAEIRIYRRCLSAVEVGWLADHAAVK